MNYIKILMNKVSKLVTQQDLGIGDENYIKELRSVAQSLFNMGNKLDSVDDVREYNNIGFNKIDKGNWGKYQANRNLSNMSDEELVILVSQLQRVLTKYSRTQLPKIFAPAEVDRVMNFKISHVVSKIAISFVKISDSLIGAKVKGYIDKSIFRDFLNIMKKYGFIYNSAFKGSTIDKQNFSKIDFVSMANDLDAFGIDVFEPNKSLLQETKTQTDSTPPQPAASAATIMVSSNGRELIFKLSGFLADKFQQYRGLLQQFGIRARKEVDYRRREVWVNYAPTIRFPYSDFKAMAKTLGMDVSTAPDDLIDTSQNISPEDISRKQQEINMFGKAMILLEGDMFVIRFPYDRAIIDAIKTKMIRIKPEWDNDRKAWKTKDLDTALEIFQFFKDYRPDWELDTTAIDKAVVDRDTRNAELRKPIPEVEAELDPKFKLFPYQNEGVRFLNKTNGNALIGDEMGLGKFQSVDSKLLTPNGFIRMGDVKIGDEVFGSDGLPHKVTAIFPQGLKDCYEIEFTDGSKTTSGDEHLWSVRTALQKWRNSPHKTMQLQEFKDKLHDKDGNTEYFIPMVCPLKFEKKELAVDPYVLGALIGDGSLSQHTVGFTSTDRFMADEIQSLSDNKFVVNDLSHKYAWSLTNTNKNEFSLKNEIKKMNLDVLSYYKHIPNDYKFSSIDQRTSLLQGLMDTDGGVDTKDGIVITYSSTSEQLINDVQFIVESLGGTARKTTRVTKFTYKGIKKDGRRSWRINISLPTDIKPFRLPRKLEVYKPRSKYKPYRGFKSVTHIGKIECQCITVDSTDHLYATDHCILTHNTLQTLAWCASNNKRALVVCPKNMRLTWIEEAMKFFPNYYSGKTAELKADELRKGKIPNLQNVNLASVNYQSVGKFEGPISQAGFDVIVMDESHRVKDPKAQQTQKLLQLSQLFPHHILLSGTAIKNKKEELATQLAIIAPQMGVTAAQLRRMSYGQLRNLIHDVYIQRQKSTVLKDLPPKTQKNLNVEMPNLPQMPRFIAPGAGSSTYTVQDVDGNTYELNREYVAKYKKKMADAKAVHTAEFVQNILDDTDENVLVFSESVQATKEIANILGPIALLHYGSMRDDDRERVKKDFMDPQKPYRVLVSTTASLKEGATLTKASTVVFNDVAWTAADMAQAEARTHRPGQKKNVSVYWMTAAGHPWDEKLNAILRKKYLIHKQVNLGENLSPEEKEFLNTKIPGEEELEKIISLGGKRPKKDTENQGPEEPYELDDETVIKSSYRHRILSKTGFRI